MTTMAAKEAERSDVPFRPVVAAAPEAIVVLDRSGAIRSVNKVAERIFGYGAAELLGRKFNVLMSEPLTAEKEIIGSVSEVAGRRKDGSVFPMDLAVGEARVEDEVILVAIIRDISKRKPAEAPERESEARLRSMLDSVPDAIIVIDEIGTIQSFSPAAERLFGHTSAEAVGRNVSILMPAPYKEAHVSFLERYLRTGEQHIIGIGRVVVGQRKSGETFPMELHVSEFGFAGNRFFTGFARDLTEQQAAKRRIQDLQAELLHASRLSVTGQMASTMAHELNQPLTAVMNYLEAARRLLESGAHPAERIGDLMSRAIAQAERAGDVIRQLRQFISTGETERRAESLNKLVEEALALALVGSRHFGVRVGLDLDPGLPTVLADGVQIQQVVLNLVRNAVEAMAEVERRELNIATATIAGENAAEVTVADSGPGIAPEIAARLFQPFVTTKKTGMGLGLSICREIVEAHQGRLSVAAAAAGGTVFRLTLPMPPGENRGESPVAAVPEDLASAE